jgi:uncharacterized protein involved in exopolysaccharide biosynthesis
MSRILDSVYTGETSLGPHYEQKLRVTFTDVWRHKLLVLVTVAVVLVIGITLTLMVPKRYTAEAYVRHAFGAGEITSTDEKSGAGANIGIDASMLVETESRLLQSPALAQRVVQRVGLERIRSGASEDPFSSWLQAQFYGDVAKTPEFQKDLAARKLLRGLLVKTEPRVYQIVVQYTALDPELAALIANAFVVEFLQTITLQTLLQQRDVAERELRAERATLGEKHPRVVEARMRLEAADALLKGQQGKTAEEIQRTAGGKVTFAQAVSVPSSPNPPVLIGFALLVGLGGGIAMAALRGQRLIESDRCPSLNP